MACQHRENGHALSLCPDCREPFRDIVADLQARYDALLAAAREVVEADRLLGVEYEKSAPLEIINASTYRQEQAIRALAEMVGDDGHRRAS